MDVYHNFENFEKDPQNVLTVGTFDGVHRGHKFIIRQLIEIAKSFDGIPTVVTFNPHPQLVIQKKGKSAIKLLTTIDEKIQLFEILGIEKLVIVPFTKTFSQMPAETYVRDILSERIGLKGVVVGYDHAFGKNREGGMHTLRRIATDLNFEVFQLDEFKTDNAHISSSQIRKLLGNGDIQSANMLLGYPYPVNGKVTRGDGRGKTLGFPTANIYITHSNKLLPANGVYAVSVEVANQNYYGMSNIGFRPTFNGKQIVIEVHIFDFDQNIYDENIRIHFFAKIRNERKFENVTHLITQLQKDKKQAISLLNRTKN